MNEGMMKYLSSIGQVQAAVSKASTLDEALEESLRIVMRDLHVDHTVVWFADDREKTVLHPFYWVCSIDFTNRGHSTEEGCVGRVFAAQKPEQYLAYSRGTDPSVDADFEGIPLTSVVCVPLSNKYDKLGCIEFANREGSAPFTDEDADVMEILASMIALYIDENPKLDRAGEEKKVLISVKDIRKEYNDGGVVTRVLKGVNLNIYEGEFIVLLGESGCGKSTLLNIIGGLDKADSGEFTFMGRDMFHATEEELTQYRKENIGFIFQSYNLMPNINAKLNLELIGELVKDPMESAKALQLVKMGDKAGSYPSQLSGGQQQRISIARALVKNPKIIMADEPTAALDYETGILVLKTLEEVARMGTTLVMVTHNEEITRMADRVVRFRDGRMYEVKINKHPVHAEELVW